MSNLSREHSLRRRLAEGATLRGVFVGLPCPALVEMAGHAGLDFVVLDNEHGPAGIESTEQLARAAASAGIPAIVRVSGVDQREILRSLDLGPAGVMAPQVSSPEQAQALAQAARFPPEGVRGVAFSTRAAGYGFFGGAEYLRRANAETLVVAQLETAAALERLDELLGTPGVDLWFIGPTDLSASLGYPGQPAHPVVRAAIADAIRRIQGAGSLAGLMVSTTDDARHFVGLGVSLISFPLTTLIVGALRTISS